MVLFAFSFKWKRICKFMFFLEFIVTEIEVRFPSENLELGDTWQSAMILSSFIQ